MAPACCPQNRPSSYQCLLPCAGPPWLLLMLQVVAGSVLGVEPVVPASCPKATKALKHPAGGLSCTMP